MTIHQAISYGEGLLQQKGISQARWNAERLLLFALKEDRVKLYSDLARRLAPDEVRRYKELLARRADHYPLAYIEGDQEFFGRSFDVDENVLIPRPETEEIIKAAIALPLREQPRVLDLGSGSGNICITLAHELRRPDVFALELSRDAISVLLRNAEGSVHIVHGTLFAPPFIPDSFDLVTANLPYVEESDYQQLPRETRWEPRLALVTEDLQQTYASLLQISATLLREGGFLIFEIGYEQEHRIRSVCGAQGTLKLREVKRDMQQIPRTFVMEKSRI